MSLRKLLVLVLLGSSWASGQLSGRFFLDKETYAHGEPVFLNFELTNRGPADVEIADDDPYSFCGGYLVKISTDPGPVPSSLQDSIEEGCGPNSITLSPGQTIRRRILLNFEHEVGAPGEYDVTASRMLTRESKEEPNDSIVLLDLKERLHFRIEKHEVPPAIFNMWVGQMHSRNWKVAEEAGRVLASLAPHSHEELLLGFAQDENLKAWAPLALYRLKTERSLAALAALVKKEEPNDPVHAEGAESLARSGDLRWFPMLADVARRNAESPNYVVDAALSGGDKAIPLLNELLQSPEPRVVLCAIAGLGATGSREAVPLLINLLRDSNMDVAVSSLAALRQLTHRNIGKQITEDSVQEQYPAWAAWWAREGPTARIYKVNEQPPEIDDPAVP